MGVQSTYSLEYATAVAGMVQNSKDMKVESFVASEAIPFGNAVELNAGKVRKCQGGTDVTKLLGVAMYEDSREPGGYVAGDVVPVLRRGKIYALFNTGTKLELTLPNVWTSDDGSSPQGVFTFSAVDATGHDTVTACPAGIVCRLGSGNEGTSLILLELSLP